MENVRMIGVFEDIRMGEGVFTHQHFIMNGVHGKDVIRLVD